MPVKIHACFFDSVDSSLSFCVTPRFIMQLTNALPACRPQTSPAPALPQAEVKRQRSAAESFLLQHLGAVPATTGPAGVSFRLLVASAAQPTAAPTDLLALACGPVDNMLAFNPFLSEAAREQLRQGILLWMQLCLLEDRLDRVAKLVGAGDEYTPLLIRVSMV